ncbi:MAG: hypothetical protein ABA06_01960 [Parcubacteria bacterium C7867-001]|nr:MAG: hypothetical protein ABA06_01960 [Parcubacteria bacterium C7867-001]
MALKIISLNTWGGRIHKPLIDFVSKGEADIYCFQEVYSKREPRTEPQTVQDEQGLDVHFDLFSDLEAALPNHHGYFCPAVQGYLHDRAEAPLPVFYGIATFVRKSIPVINSVTHFVYREFRPDVFGEPPLPRNAHAIRVYDYEAKSELVLIHLHGLYQKNDKIDTPQRNIQASNLLGLAEGMTERMEEKIVICGDFNLLPNSSTHELLAQQLDMTELVTSRGFTDTRTSLYQKPIRYADYTFVTPQVNVIEFDVLVEPEVSDHRALQLICT